MKRRSFFFRLFVGNLALVAILAVVSFTIAYWQISSQYDQRQVQGQKQAIKVFQSVFERSWPTAAAKPGQADPFAWIDEYCKRIMTDLPSRLTVIAADGQVRGDSQADPTRMANHKTDDRPEVLAALAGRDEMDVRPSETVKTEFRYLAVPIRDRGGEVVGAVRVAMPVRAIAAAKLFIPRALAMAAGASLAVALLLGLLISYVWYRPLRLIGLAARRIAGGDLTGRVRITGSAELVSLADAIDQMRGALAEKIRTIDAQRNNLSAVVSNLEEGIVAVDGEGKVLLINDAAKALLNVGGADPVGLSLQATVRLPGVIELWQKLQREDSIGAELRIASEGGLRFMDVCIIRVHGAGEIGVHAVLVLRDITEIARTAEVKTEFVANASHELRTPLATIRAAVDSIPDAEGDELGDISAILDRHVGRLEQMTNDLLDLHRVERRDRQLRIEQISLGALAAWARETWIPAGEVKDLTVQVRTDHPAVAIDTDTALVRLILQNLLDNALKFTPPGGEIACELRSTDRGVQMEVCDTGCGIPAEHLGRVFERFFQVDVARSGSDAARGTGLGLAIVKHAAERLGGAVSLRSDPGEGTTVTVTLPATPAQ